MSCKNNRGIYKITSPSGRIYIGESKDIKRRWDSYKNLNGLKKQPKLYNSFLKYGIENHQFDIIEYCEIEQLKCSERFWQDEFDVLNGGLNCKLTECGEIKGEHSKETIQKMRENRPCYNGENNPNAKEVICLFTGVFYDCGIKAADAYDVNYGYLKAMLQGKRKNTTSLIYIDNYFEGIELPKFIKYEPKTKKVIDISTGIIYKSVREVSEIFNINISTLKSKLNGNLKNNTPFKYLEDEL